MSVMLGCSGIGGGTGASGAAWDSAIFAGFVGLCLPWAETGETATTTANPAKSAPRQISFMTKSPSSDLLSGVSEHESNGLRKSY
jgi:hypothetical protein